MTPAEKRLERERRTVTVMIAMYCRAHHDPQGEGGGLCAECAALHTYAMERVSRCPFGSRKPTCANCPVHCYKPEMRARIRGVMRYAGPRMLLRHPLLAVLHLADGMRKPVEK